MNTKHFKQLQERGYCAMRGRCSAKQVGRFLDRLEALWAEEGDRAGAENYFEAGIRRLANLANKDDLFRSAYANPEVLDGIRTVIGPDVRVSMVNARDVPPKTGVRMPYHTDTDSKYRPEAPGAYSATAIWMLDPFTAENGATAIVPGSHRFQEKLDGALDDLKASHPDEVLLEGDPGDVLVFNGHCWHAGRPNRTDGHRRAILVHYLRADVPRAENRSQHLDPEYADSLPADIRTLLGLDD